jgi:hypothetical protein
VGVIEDFVPSSVEFIDFLLGVKGYSSAVFETGEKNRLDRRSVEELNVLLKKSGRRAPI